MKTELLPWDGVSRVDRERSIREAAALIAAGELVAYPTETVYGLAADALSPEAVEKVFEAKGRPRSRPLLVAVRDLESACDLVEEVPKSANLLAGVFWPGPLSIVLTASGRVPEGVTAGRGSVGLRCPAHPVSRALVEEVGPITSPSANISGRRSPKTVEEVLCDLDGRIAAVIDGGPVPGGRESTVVDIRDGFEIVREGAIGASEISTLLSFERRDLGRRRTVVFVCSGNTCRSPLAASVLRSTLENLGLLTLSAGTAATWGLPASGGALTAAEESGYDLHGHRSRGLVDVPWEDVALVVGMTRRHARDVGDHLRRLGLDDPPPIVTMDDLVGIGDVPDPFLGPPEEYQEILDTFEGKRAAITVAIARLLDGGKSILNGSDRKPTVFDTVSVACDHGGVMLKSTIKDTLWELGIEVEDLGTDSEESVDYPDFAVAGARAVAEGHADASILICGTGIGMAMTADKIPGIRAANCSEEYSATMARAHNDANVLTLGARVIGPGLAKRLVQAFCTTPFEGGRHARRVDKISRLDRSAGRP
ncbi:MAG: L-threonylcarbamoyladenylate synthase [Clostridia bacterium]